MSTELKNPEFHERLSKLMGPDGINEPYAWAAKVDISKGAFFRIWNEGTIPSADLLIRIAEKTGVSIHWLLVGKGPMYEKDRAGAGTLNEHGATYRVPEIEATVVAPRLPPAPSPELQEVYDAVIEVMTSGDQGAIAALTANALYFQEAVRNGKDLAELKRDMEVIKRVLNPGGPFTDVKEG